MPQIDQCVGKRLERIVNLTNPLKAKQQTPKLVFRGEHALDRAKALLEDRCVEVPLAASLGCFTATQVLWNIGMYVPVEDGPTIGPQS
ncbi:hypothetical protein PQQ96_25385 [Paraburkholderia sediminicola]|uniref:hypothetical protein n=1 Tax=Paraburkholderia sediminicola TaxID=458836 RepID=UPI0038B7F4D5